MRSSLGSGLWEREAGPCAICGQVACNHYPPEPWDGRKRPVPPPTYTPTENVYRNERLVAAANEPITWAFAVELGLVATDPPKKPIPRPVGKRKGQRARRPAEDRMKAKDSDR